MLTINTKAGFLLGKIRIKVLSEKEKYADLLNTPQWEYYRSTVISLFGRRCQHCGKKKNLQVHHKRYIPGLKPWQYKDPDDIAVLCRECHMIEHGIIQKRHVCGHMKNPAVFIINAGNRNDYLARKNKKP